MPGKEEYSIPKSSKLVTIWTVKFGKESTISHSPQVSANEPSRTLRSGNGVTRTVIWGKLSTY
jgi:hypothetical protein